MDISGRSSNLPEALKELLAAVDPLASRVRHWCCPRLALRDRTAAAVLPLPRSGAFDKHALDRGRGLLDSRLAIGGETDTDDDQTTE